MVAGQDLAHAISWVAVVAWQNKDNTSTILSERATGQRPLTQTGLDELPDSRPRSNAQSATPGATATSPQPL
jgi:hypothetical protein